MEAQELSKQQIGELVTSTHPANNKDTIEKYMTRLDRKHQSSSYWGLSRAPVMAAAKKFWFPDETKPEEIKATESSSTDLSMSLVKGLTQGAKGGIVKEYMASTYGKNGTHGYVSHGNTDVTVYDLGDGYWGYADLSHGEIEVIPAGEQKGTTVGFRSLLFTATTTIKGENTSVTAYITGEQALVFGKTHKYTINKYH
jgi:hypothetical protein